MLFRKSMPLQRISLTKAKWLALLPIGLAPLSACSSTPVATVDPFRTALRDVCVSREDKLTEPTARAIERNNLALREMLDRSSQCPKPRGKVSPSAPAETKTEAKTS